MLAEARPIPAVSSSSAPVRWREQAWMECEVRGPLCEGESAPRGLGRRGQKLAEDSTRTPGPLAFVRNGGPGEKKVDFCLSGRVYRVEG